MSNRQMVAVLYLVFVGILAGQLRSRITLLSTFTDLPGYLCSLGLTLFLVNWVNFLLYVVVGWGGLYRGLSWALLLVAVLALTGFWKPTRLGPSPLRPVSASRWNGWFLFLVGFVAVRFYAGLDVDGANNVWSVFSFVDTAFHLSVANAFLAAPHFPPMDLDMAPYPLKYHFLADFNVAHLVKLGLPALSAIWVMNGISALAMVGTLWAVFERWLGLSSRWIMLAGLMFLFLNTSLLNLIHYLTLHPKFFDPDNLFLGLLRFPYFNFESLLSNMLEPQRGLLFSLPVVLLILHAAFGARTADARDPADRIRTLSAFVLVCFLPLGHIVAFVVLAFSLLPQLWRHRAWFFSRAPIWLPALAIGLLQLFYLAAYGPPANAAFSKWASTGLLPLQDFAALPSWLRRAAFWFFADGDFLFWGLMLALMAFIRRFFFAPAAGITPRLWPFLVQWRGYFAVCGGFFILINFYRYSFDWGDSNKLVFFLNLGLALVITLGLADLVARWHRLFAHALWGFFLLLCTVPPAYAFYRNVINTSATNGTVLLFTNNSRAAADWIRQTLPLREVIVTAANNDLHFVTPLAGRPTLAGIYGDSNRYRQDERGERIRRIYENDDLTLMKQLGVRYLCITRVERTMYHLNPVWDHRMKSGQGVVFSVGEGPEDYYSVYIFDSNPLHRDKVGIPVPAKPDEPVKQPKS